MIQITPRERNLAIGLVAMLVTFATWTAVFRPARERIRTLERILPEKRTQVRHLQTQSAEYQALANQFKGLRARIASQDPAFQLPRFLETMITRHKLDAHVTKMQPGVVQIRPDYSETVVTIELQDIAPRQLVAFLTALETAEAVVRVGSLYFRTDATNETLLDATVEICSPRLTAEQTQVAQLPPKTLSAGE
ncbi:MAG TPA: type II secretion system protein GspM [Sedimentisphaerales bacterium]|nr:type II secretion system protein GspM [Sedimentisphaerales bacterium]HQI27775.1 type II secretion system protein GspM [Sedimentisphaerales bacterium]